MKTAAQPAPITQKTITTRTLSVDPDPSARKIPEFWDYIESIPPEAWSEHMVYIYRTDPRASAYGDGQSYLEKCPGYIEMPDGSQVPFNDREEIERAIMEKHGGKAYRLIVKRKHERVTEGKSSNDAPPKYRHQTAPANGNGSGVTVSPMNEASATADVAKAAMTTMAGQEKQAIEVATRAVGAAAEMVQRLAAAPATTPGPQDDVMKQAMVVMLQRALNPPDPLEQMTKFFALMNSIRPQDSSLGGQMPTYFNKVMELAMDRVINPQSATPPVNASAELVRQLPAVASYVTDAIREWRLGTEAQRDTAQVMARQQGGVTPGQPAKTLPASNVAQPRPTQASVPNNSTNQPQEAPAMAPQIEFIEAKIVEIFQEQLSAEDAADECFVFLDRVDQRLVAQLAPLGEAGLMQLFSTRPILRACTANPARLTEFIRAFIKFANESLGKPTPGEVVPTVITPPGNA